MRHQLYLFALLSLVFGVIFLTYKHYGTTYDEKFSIERGKVAFSYYSTLGEDTSVLLHARKPENYLTHGSSIELLRELFISFLSNPTIDSYHFIIALFSLIAFYYLYKCVYLLTQKKWLACTTVLLLLCMPRFYGDIFTNSKDVAPVFVLLGIMYYSFLCFLGKRTFMQYVILGGLIGVAANLRPILIYSYYIFFIVSFIQTILGGKLFRQFLFKQMLLLLFSFGVWFLLSPILISNPSDALNIFMASIRYPYIGNVLFEGIIYPVRDLPWYYIIKWILISTPVITLVFILCGTIYCIYHVVRAHDSKRYVYGYTLLMFWYPLLYSFLRPTVYDAWRQLLFLVGPMIFLAGMGMNALTLLKPKWITYLFISLYFINICITTIAMIRLHPYEYIYFNAFVGGLRGAYKKYETDYWGATFKEATEWIYDHRRFYNSSDGKLYIDPCLPHLVIPYLQKDVVIDPTRARVRYCFLRTNNGKDLEEHIVHIVERDGAPLNIITEVK